MPPPARRRTGGAGSGAGSQEAVRRHNLGALLGHLHRSGPLTRADLTARLGLNRSTTAALVSELSTLGAVREELPARRGSGAGRPSHVVLPRADRVQVLAVHIELDRLVVAVVGLGGRVLVRRYRRLAAGRHEPAEVAAMVARLAASALGSPDAAGRVVGVGVSVPGVVRHDDGCVRFAPNLGWVDAPIGTLLADLLGTGPVLVGNDADLGVIAEHARGAGRGVDDVVFLTAEVGVGTGLIVGGHPLVGAGGYAGELGHMRVRPDGRPCRCGSRGCWETEIGAAAIGEALGRPHASAEDVTRALRELPPADADRLAGVAEHLGIGLATLVNLLNPRMIILGGLLRELFPLTEPVVRRTVQALALRAPAEQLTLQVPRLGGDAVLLGAADLAFGALLADPAGVLRAGLHQQRGAAS